MADNEIVDTKNFKQWPKKKKKYNLAENSKNYLVNFVKRTAWKNIAIGAKKLLTNLGWLFQ